MPKITYLTGGGDLVVDAAVGSTIMQAAVLESVDGILAECGGNAMCATCHVYVDSDRIHLLPSMEEDEADMLDCGDAEVRPNSRLSCRLTVTQELDGLRVEVPHGRL